MPETINKKNLNGWRNQILRQFYQIQEFLLTGGKMELREHNKVEMKR